ncbi:MAG TPA: HAD-IC family P-type ATPase [Acidimicrobiia bacterium]
MWSPLDPLRATITLLMGRADDARRRPPGRRVWARSGRAHIEVRGVHRPDVNELVEAVEQRLRALDGVQWAVVVGAIGRVVVAFDEDAVSVPEMVDTIEDVETLYELAREDVLTDGWDHPGDGQTLRWGVVELGADAAGMALGAVARIMRLPRLPIEVAAAVPAFDNLPPVRLVLERRRDLEAGVVSAAALLQGLGQGPAGLVVDACHRVVLLREAGARRAAWERIEPRLVTPERARVPAFERSERPAPLPDGIVERYARTVSIASVGVGGIAAAVTRRPRLMADVVLAAIPRASRLGRDGFAAQLGTQLAQGDAVVMEASVLRRLDRVDTVVIDESVLESASPGRRALLDAVHAAAQDLVVVRGAAGDAADVTPDLVVPGGDELEGSVRRLQEEGRVVAVVSASSGPALFAADCGVGIMRAGAPPPWGADVLCPTLHAAALVVDATARARTASRRAVAIAAAGSTFASILAWNPAPFGARRAVVVTNAAALVALGVGVWSATGLDVDALPAGDDPEVAWHALDAHDVTTRLGTRPEGLAGDAIEGRRSSDGRSEGPSLVRLLTQELANPLTLVLGAGGAISAIAGSLNDALLMTGVLALNGLVGATQRWRTEQAIGHLGDAVSRRLVRVRRDGTEHSVPPEELVDGDVVVLQAGDAVPVDCRLLTTSRLETDESALTGESLPVKKDAAPVDAATAVAERSSMAYAGTAVAAGRADAVVVATGDRTEARKGSGGGARAPTSGVEHRLETLTRRSVPIVLAAGGVLTGSSLLRGVPAREAVSTGVSLAAAAVPEGLPFLATVAQSGAARRLSRRGVLVRNPRVLEALGRVDVLCFDKTGTLTEGKLQLHSVSDGDVVEPMPEIDGRRRLVLAAAARATPARRDRKLPHPTDEVVLDGASAVELDTDLGATDWRRSASLPFASSRGYHAVVGHTARGSLLSVKGAPEVVLPRCDTWRRGGRVEELDAGVRARMDRHVERLAKQGLRVLAVAERGASGRVDLDDERVARLELRGFVTVADVARPSAMAPLAQLQRAGIAVVMLTGDHPTTAAAIASELGLLAGQVVSGTQLDELDDDELDALVDGTTVFARVTPVHKVRIVQAFQRRGRVVAMTGDGANDAQAIRLADIGIAFGPRATSAARAVADLVVVEDSLETLITAIIEGRAMWASVRSALALLLGGNLGEVMFTAGAGIVTGRSPLNARQLLAVNLLTDLAPAMAIALQPPLIRDVDLRREGPDTSLGGALARDVAVRAAATAGAAGSAWTIARFTGTPTRASTVALASLVGAQLGQTLAIGHRSPLVLASGLLSVGALVAIVQTPGVSGFFGCRPLGPVGWTIAAGTAATATAGAAVANAVLSRRPAAHETAPAILRLPPALREDSVTAHAGV